MCIAIVALMLSAYGFGYYRGYWARGPIVYFGRDTGDSLAQHSTKAGYDPYFTKANPIPTQPK